MNRKRIQKSEVASLLESAGFSKSNPYYIVQQGKVANLCVMKDKDRLNLLKEVAGTTVYEERRSESIKIMEDTASKQGKVEEVLAFIEERLSELEKEKKELSEYEQHDKMRRAVEYTIYDRDFIQANEQLVGLESDREGLRDEQQTLFADLRDVQDEIVQEDELLNNAKTSMDRLISRRDALATDMQQYANRKSSLEIDIQDLESSRQAKERNHDDWRKQLVTINQSIATCQQELSVLQPQIDQQEQQLQTLTTSLTNIDKRRTQLIVKQGRGKQFHSKKERDNFLTEQIGIMEGQYTKKQSIKKQRQAELTRQQQALQNEQQALIKDEQSNQTRLQSYDQLSTRIHDDIAVRNTLQEQRKTLWRETEKLQEQITEAKQDLERGKQQLNRTLPRTITQGLAAMELFVRQHNIRGYYGPLIDNFSLKADAFRNAVEVAAGNALFHIIVENDDIAAKLIKELERQNAGRLTFLPLSRLRVQPQRGFPDSTDVRPLIDVAIEYEAFLNPAMQLVSLLLLFCPLLYLFVANSLLLL